MGNLRKPLFVAVGLTVAACTGLQLDRARSVAPEGSPFDNVLYRGYLNLAEAEFDEADFNDSDFFALRAIQSGTNGGVGPQAIGERLLPDETIPELASARRQLVAVLEDTATEKAPDAAARAQVGFDCWIQEQEENFQPDDIAACRAQFTAALAEAQKAVEPPTRPSPPAQPITPVQEEATPAQPITPVQEEATPAPRAAPVRIVIQFDFDSTMVESTEAAKIQQIIAAAKERGRARISISGHTDRAGTDAYNNRLAERRVEAVANELSKVGITDARVSLLYFGESLPLVETKDGVRESRNRRVVVTVE